MSVPSRFVSAGDTDFIELETEPFRWLVLAGAVEIDMPMTGLSKTGPES